MPTNISRMDTAMLRCFLLGGCNRLGMDREEVNALNVFPVPDGDTGINMYLTVSSAGKKILNAPDSYGVGRLAADFSQGSLMGARGNSGVILSQIFRGLAVALSEKKNHHSQSAGCCITKGCGFILQICNEAG